MSDNAKVKLFQKIANIMGKVERVPKNGYNNFHKYQYVTESDLIDSVRKFMAEEGLIVYNNVKHYEIDGEVATVTIEFTLACAETGETISSVLIGQGQDKGDKAFYKAYAGATKYFLMKTFLIPTGDDPEADTSVDERNTKAPAPRQNSHRQQPKGNMSAKEAGEVMLNFGKHKGKTLGQMYREDKSYLEWLANADKTDQSIKQAISIMFEAVKNKDGKASSLSNFPPEPPMTFDGVEIDDSQLPFNM